MLDMLLGNSGLAALIAFALVLIPAVIIHELGHYLAGKSVGITILEFGIGFPPRVGRLFTWRGTEFTLNWLPLGGFVRPLGEDIVSQKGDDEENADRVEAEKRGISNIKSVSEATPIQRIFFFSAGAIANLISAFLLFILAGMLGVPGISLDVAYVDPNSALYAAGLRNNDVIESIDGQNFLTPTDLVEQIERAPNDPVEIVVRRGEEGEVVQITSAGETSTPLALGSSLVRIVEVVNGSPADEVGIRPGDFVVTFNGETVLTTLELQQMTVTNLGNEVTLELLRPENGTDSLLEISIVPREDPPPNEGAMGVRISNAGVSNDTGVIYQALPNQVMVNLSLTESVQYSTQSFVGLFAMIADLPSQIAQGNISAAEARPVSVVGISQIGGRFLTESIEERQPVRILNYIALISIALGLTNLLPIPALDGGRILFVFIEMVRGRPIPPEREGMVHLLGLIFLLSVTVVVIINDILNPVTDLLP